MKREIADQTSIKIKLINYKFGLNYYSRKLSFII